MRSPKLRSPHETASTLSAGSNHPRAYAAPLFAAALAPSIGFDFRGNNLGEMATSETAGVVPQQNFNTTNSFGSATIPNLTQDLAGMASNSGATLSFTAGTGGATSAPDTPGNSRMIEATWNRAARPSPSDQRPVAHLHAPRLRSDLLFRQRFIR